MTKTCLRGLSGTGDGVDLTYSRRMFKLGARGPLIFRNAARRLLTTILLVTSVTAATTAFGQTGSVSSRSQRYRSERHWAMELRLGPYSPNIDSEDGLDQASGKAGPHQQYFGNSTRLLTAAELDFQIFQGFGSLAVGVSGGYFRENAKAFVDPGPGGSLETRSGDNTRLTLFPTSLSLVYRFDVPAIRWGFPLVPYAKAGLDWVYWSITNANGAVAVDSAGNKGRGDATGFHGTLGLSLLLDFFDAASAQEFDSDTGINHTYLFVELSHYEINGLGSKVQPHLGDTTWAGGLLFEF